jgi:PHP domain
MLLCDFHIHTNYSDGKLTVPEVVDFYRKRGFDCVCITDHLTDPRRLIGKLSGLANLALGADQLDEYFDVLERERRRAWPRYEMLLLTSIEFNKDGYTKKPRRICSALTCRLQSAARWICLKPSDKSTLKAALRSSPIRTSWKPNGGRTRYICGKIRRSLRP